SVASDVRSAFLDLQQADRVLESETRNVQEADQSLEIAKGNLSAGLGTQLDILQAASDVTRTRTTRLGAFYLHNVALARLARASRRKARRRSRHTALRIRARFFHPTVVRCLHSRLVPTRQCGDLACAAAIECRDCRATSRCPNCLLHRAPQRLVA